MAAALAVLPTGALAVTEQSAIVLVRKVVAELTRIVNSGKPEKQMFSDFRAMFGSYGHIGVIARYVLGPEARGLSAAKFAEYEDAFAGYMSRKYGRRFRLFIGASVAIKGARRRKNFVEVDTVATLTSMEPFEVNYMVSTYNGRERFHDISLRGVSLLSVEHSEVQAMLDEHRGNVDKLIAELKRT